MDNRLINYNHPSDPAIDPAKPLGQRSFRHRQDNSELERYRRRVPGSGEQRNLTRAAPRQFRADSPPAPPPVGELSACGRAGTPNDYFAVPGVETCPPGPGMQEQTRCRTTSDDIAPAACARAIRLTGRPAFALPSVRLPAQAMISPLALHSPPHRPRGDWLARTLLLTRWGAGRQDDHRAATVPGGLGIG